MGICVVATQGNFTTLEVSRHRPCLGEMISLGSLGSLWTSCTEPLLHTTLQGDALAGEMAKHAGRVTRTIQGEKPAAQQHIEGTSNLSWGVKERLPEPLASKPHPSYIICNKGPLQKLITNLGKTRLILE